VLIRAAELDGARVDLRIDGGRVVGVAPGLRRQTGEEVLEAEGSALLPGLHDHHIHLFSCAAARASVACGPPQVRDREGLSRALSAAAPTSGWIRGVGYHESVAGPLDRSLLDAVAPSAPVRIQHRSGALWSVNSAGLQQLGVDGAALPAGVECDPRGRPTGRLFGLDRWLRERLDSAHPSLGALGLELASYGVTGVTDASVDNDRDSLAAFGRALEAGELPQRLVVMGRPDLPGSEHARIEIGAEKIYLREDDLPSPRHLRGRIADAHAAGRPVALHCVTRAELVFAATALRDVGPAAGDRLEHAAVAPPEIVDLLVELPVTVVTQPHFIAERGDTYREDVDARDLPWLYRCRGLIEAGVALGGGTDAPFGGLDPWAAMRAAASRKTEAGVVLGPSETLSPERALALFTSPPFAPGAAPRRIEAGAVADLCLLDRPWARARHVLSSAMVRATFRDGQPIWRGDSS
jgi:predicted amidohydrolase YtcJ